MRIVESAYVPPLDEGVSRFLKNTVRVLGVAALMLTASGALKPARSTDSYNAAVMDSWGFDRARMISFLEQNVEAAQRMTGGRAHGDLKMQLVFDHDGRIVQTRFYEDVPEELRAVGTALVKLANSNIEVQPPHLATQNQPVMVVDVDIALAANPSSKWTPEAYQAYAQKVVRQLAKNAPHPENAPGSISYNFEVGPDGYVESDTIGITYKGDPKASDILGRAVQNLRSDFESYSLRPPPLRKGQKSFTVRGSVSYP